MRILYFDCICGISGDMTVGAFLDLGVPFEYLKAELEKLNINDYKIELKNSMKNGINAKKFEVIINHHRHEHRNLSDINQIIDNSELNGNIKKISKAIFMRIADAEAKVHGTTVEAVHFHEVGAIDSIIDIVGTAICVDYIKPDKIFASPLKDGFGFVNCQHGKIPVPVPATVEIFANRKVAVEISNIEGELITPTGAAIIAELAEHFGRGMLIVPQKIGYGAGTKNFEIPNVLRLILSEQDEQDKIFVLETNIDDTTAEILGHTMNILFENGALDVFYTPIYMKKNRPAYKLTVLCKEYEKFEKIIFSETSTLGIRRYEADRTILQRESATVETPFGTAKVKIKILNEKRQIIPEYESAAELSEKSGLPLTEIYRIITHN